jgi:hypothetical protein
MALRLIRLGGCGVVLRLGVKATGRLGNPHGHGEVVNGVAPDVAMLTDLRKQGRDTAPTECV